VRQALCMQCPHGDHQLVGDVLLHGWRCCECGEPILPGGGRFIRKRGSRRRALCLQCPPDGRILGGEVKFSGWKCADCGFAIQPWLGRFIRRRPSRPRTAAA
jgi:hypothetical protein